MRVKAITKLACIAVLVGAGSFVPLQITAQTTSETQTVLDHHLDAFGNLNLEEILADYTDESILFTPNGVVHGVSELKSVFGSFFAEFGKPGASFEMHNTLVEGNMAYTIWSAETADNVYEFATDTFFIEDGKIARQSFAAKVTPKK